MSSSFYNDPIRWFAQKGSGLLMGMSLGAVVGVFIGSVTPSWTVMGFLIGAFFGTIWASYINHLQKMSALQRRERGQGFQTLGDGFSWLQAFFGFAIVAGVAGVFVGTIIMVLVSIPFNIGSLDILSFPDPWTTEHYLYSARSWFPDKNEVNDPAVIAYMRI